MEPAINEQIDADEADLIDQHEPADPSSDEEPPDPDDDYPHATRGLEPDDPLLEVIVRIYAEHADHTSLADTIDLVLNCRDQLDVIATPAALPELVERLTRQRLTDTQTDAAGPPPRSDKSTGSRVPVL